MPRARTPVNSKATRKLPQRVPVVAVLVGITNNYGRDVVRGISEYVHTYGPWRIHFDYEFTRWVFPPWLKSWRGDGIISRLSCPEITRYARRRRIPVIDLNEVNPSLKLPLVYNDQQAVGRMAAEHLMERGFQYFAYIGQRGLHWSDERSVGFQNAILSASRKFYEFSGTPVLPSTTNYRMNVWETENVKIRNWLRKLPKPIGIFACNSFRGWQLLEACRAAEIAVPETVAIVTGDNEEVACELAIPSLTGIHLNGKGIGYTTASLLDRMMCGEDLANTAVYLPPVEVVVRNSSRIAAVSDDILGRSLQFIRENAKFDIGVQDVAKHVGVSLRKLHLLFRKELNSSVHERIVACKLDTAMKLLRNTELNIQEIAHRSGFNHHQRMSDLFLEKMGMRPSEYRRVNQA